MKKILILMLLCMAIMPLISATTYYNQSDGFSVSHITTEPSGIWNNGSHFWLGGGIYEMLYLLNNSGELISSYNLTLKGFNIIGGITGNGSHLWITSFWNKKIFQTDLEGNPIRNFTVTSGTLYPGDVYTNGSLLWTTVYASGQNGDVNVTDLNGVPYDYFDTNVFGSANPNGITGNGSDLWIMDYNDDDEIYHTNLSGSLIDNFDIREFGIGSGYRLWLDNTNNNKNFWITDPQDNFIYHLNTTAPIVETEETSNLTTFTESIVKLIMGFLTLIILAISLGGFYMYVRDNFKGEVTPEQFVKWAITLIIALFLFVALINYIGTEVL